MYKLCKYISTYNVLWFLVCMCSFYYFSVYIKKDLTVYDTVALYCPILLYLKQILDGWMDGTIEREW